MFPLPVLIAEDSGKLAASLTLAIEQIDEARVNALAAAEFPVPGLSIGEDGSCLYNGIPFDQVSDAERLTISVAIAMASNPKLRVIRIRDGSLLDDDAMARLAAMADKNDYQIWIERVDGSGTVGFVIEDGHIKGADANAD